MSGKIMMSAVRVSVIIVLVVMVVWYLVAQPTFRTNRRSSVSVDPARMKETVVMLSQTLHPRDWEHTENLSRCADFIGSHLTRAGAVLESQAFTVGGKEYRNVIARFGGGKGWKVVVGAHYDSFGTTPGADDNASGLAALIEVAYLLGQHEPHREVELVAYVLEEPPFFRSPSMGSFIHAKSLAGEKATLAGVIVLEMVGYFRDEWGSQSFPMPLLRFLYPSRGNFIAVVGPWDQGAWVKAVKGGMKGTTDLPVYSMRAPAALPGVDFSDHMNYWPFGYNAVMITDTAFYRNNAYHGLDDTAEHLDFIRMAKVATAVFEAIRP